MEPVASDGEERAARWIGMDIRFDPGLSSRIYTDAHHGLLAKAFGIFNEEAQFASRTTFVVESPNPR